MWTQQLRHILVIVFGLQALGIAHAQSQRSGSITIKSNPKTKKRKTANATKKTRTDKRKSIKVVGNSKMRPLPTGSNTKKNQAAIRVVANPVRKGQLTGIKSIPAGSTPGAITIVDNPALAPLTGLAGAKPASGAPDEAKQKTKSKSSKQKSKTTKKRRKTSTTDN